MLMHISWFQSPAVPSSVGCMSLTQESHSRWDTWPLLCLPEAAGPDIKVIPVCRRVWVGAKQPHTQVRILLPCPFPHWDREKPLKTSLALFLPCLLLTA